jgi:uncharacterized membrane protein
MTAPSRTTSTIATATAAVASALAYPFLPNRVATHFDAEGHPDRYSSRLAAAVLFPAIMAGIQLINDRLGAWPGASDRDDVKSGAQARDEAVALTELALLSADLSVLSRAVGLPIDTGRLDRGVYGLLMVALGNILPKLPRNGLIGIRTPWSLADAGVWERTHRVGGYLLTGAGLVSLASLFTGNRASRLPTIAVLAAVGLSVAYSFVAFERRDRMGC